MASMASFTMAALPPPPSAASRRLPLPLKTTLIRSSTPRLPNKSSRVVASSRKEEQRVVVAGLAAAAAVAAAAFATIPAVADAAQPGLSPSLKNFLLSIVSGGAVLAALLGAVVAVSNFDPVKRA